ncbi:MAG: hypothetical protein ACLP7Q_10925 [Isosphaeraceae bacterium]
MFVNAAQSRQKPINLSQALLDGLLRLGGMFDVVLDRCLQVVDRCRDRLCLLSERQ